MKITNFFLVLILSGCSVSPFTGERMGTIKIDSSKDEALSIAGDYDGFETLNNGVEVYKYSSRHMSGWNNDITNYYLYFKNDKLISLKHDNPWVDNRLAQNLQAANQNIQQQEIINQNQQYLQQKAYNDFILRQNQQRFISQQKEYQQQQIILEKERNKNLRLINNNLIFSK